MLTFTGRPEMAAAERFRDEWLASDTVDPARDPPAGAMAGDAGGDRDRGETQKLCFAGMARKSSTLVALVADLRAVA